MKYICQNKCYFMDRIFSPGEVVDFKEGVKVGRHFEKAATPEESMIYQLRKMCAEGNIFFESTWGIDKLKELLGIAPPPAPEEDPEDEAEEE